MGTRPTFLQTPTVEIDQDRYEELIKNELKYQIYKKNSAPYFVMRLSRLIRKIIQTQRKCFVKRSFILMALE